MRMCTLTYLPDPSGEGYIFTSNRDERTARAIALQPAPMVVQGVAALAPIDAQAKGTWIGASELGHSVCLLNGAFEAHTPRASYRHSRGLVVLQALAAASGEELFEALDLHDIEPFTLVYVAAGPLRLLELRWDGLRKHVREFDAGAPRIWSSCTLYTPAMQAEREGWFARWIAGRKAFSADEIIHFHCTEGRENPETALLMKRGDVVQTVSTTCIVHQPAGLEMRYLDHLRPEWAPPALARPWGARLQTTMR
jgi:hypothetical protein